MREQALATFLASVFSFVNNLPLRIKADNKQNNVCKMPCTVSEAQEIPGKKWFYSNIVSEIIEHLTV